MRATKLLVELNVLTPGQLQEFHLWLDQLTYDEAQAKLHQKHKIFISTGRLARYYQALGLSQDIAASTDLDFQIQDYVNLVNGEPLDFDAAGLHRIKKRVFDLTLDPKTKPSVLPILFRILTYNDTLALRQQRAQIQERRVALEERKQQWRESQPARGATSPGLASPASPRPSSSPADPLPEAVSPDLPPPPVTREPARPADMEAAKPSVSRPAIYFPTLRDWYAKLASPSPTLAKPSPVARALATSAASHLKRTGPPVEKHAPNPHEHCLSTHFPFSFHTAATAPCPGSPGVISSFPGHQDSVIGPLTEAPLAWAAFRQRPKRPE